MQVDARDLGGVLVEGDVTDVVLGQRRVLAARPHHDGHVEPLPPVDGVRRRQLGGVLGVVGLVQRQFHVARDRTGDQKHVRMTR